jgi:hypothetical protein
MIGNCLSFAICDFIKNGGELMVSFSRYQHFPHFSVQRNEKVYDLEIIKMYLYVFLYLGESRQRSATSFDYVKCKRYVIAKTRKYKHCLTPCKSHTNISMLTDDSR